MDAKPQYSPKGPFVAPWEEWAGLGEAVLATCTFGRRRGTPQWAQEDGPAPGGYLTYPGMCWWWGT